MAIIDVEAYTRCDYNTDEYIQRFPIYVSKRQPMHSV